MLRKDDDELVIQPDRLMNALSEFVSDLQIFGSIPASNAFSLQVGIEAFNKRLIFGGVANEASVVLDGVLSQGTDIGNEGIGQACLAQEGLRNVSFRAQEGICPDGRGCQMVEGV